MGAGLAMNYSTYTQLVFASGIYVKWKMYCFCSQGMTEERECSG